MAGIADLVERVNQGVLTVGLQCQVEVNRGISGWRAQSLRVLRDGIPYVLHPHFVPTWCKGSRDTAVRIKSTESRWQRMITGDHRDGFFSLFGPFRVKMARGPECPKNLKALKAHRRESFYGITSRHLGWRCQNKGRHDTHPRVPLGLSKLLSTGFDSDLTHGFRLTREWTPARPGLTLTYPRRCAHIVLVRSAKIRAQCGSVQVSQPFTK